MLRKAIGSLGVMTLLLGLVTGPSALAGEAPPELENLDPGGFRNINQDLTVNVVFVGYERGTGVRQIDEDAFLAELPGAYRSIVRVPYFAYGIKRETGNRFRYDYDVRFANGEFESAFFDYLSDIAEPQPLTLYQEEYNGQENASQTVEDNHWIDAPSVERWLADHAGDMLGIDTSQYTVFFVNWWGRDDFVHHVYVKTDEPDPDTGYDFGTIRETRKIIAWGGTTPDDEENGLGSLHRIWFHDLSAGPEAWTDNWNVDVADLDGSGRLDYRMPPVWEYGTDGYRPFDDLSGDLGKILRYVAIDLLFTTSPLYDPNLPQFIQPTAIENDITVYQGDPSSDGTEFFDLGLLNAELEEVRPTNEFTSELSARPFEPQVRRVFRCTMLGVDCYDDDVDNPDSPLTVWHFDRLGRFLEGDADYEVPNFAINLKSRFSDLVPLGYADDNYENGTQTVIFGFDSPFIRALGYGFTTTFIHEVGHHIGLSHPHDGYDWEADVDFGPGERYYFAWAGDESNSIMSYIDLNWDFSQFDRDNMDRYLTAAYINEANELLGRIYRHPDSGQHSEELLDADARAGAALDAYAAMDYREAVGQAKAAYDIVVQIFQELRMQEGSVSGRSADRRELDRPHPAVDPVHPHRFE